MAVPIRCAGFCAVLVWASFNSCALVPFAVVAAGVQVAHTCVSEHGPMADSLGCYDLSVIVCSHDKYCLQDSFVVSATAAGFR